MLCPLLPATATMQNDWMITPEPASGATRSPITSFKPMPLWKVWSYQYDTYTPGHDGEPESCRHNRIHLASNGAGSCRGCCWESPNGMPTAYHGHWSCTRESGTLVLQFNARGPEAGWLQFTHLRKIFPGVTHTGRDGNGRKVVLTSDGCFQLKRMSEQDDGSDNVQCEWVVLEEMPSMEVEEAD